jgi:ABC-type sugar transport system ATPase subunit
VAPAISLNGVTRTFGARPAIVGVRLVVERGEVVLLRGANGAGKSTLLRVVAADRA